MNSHWALFEILPYLIFIVAVVVCVIAIGITSCHEFLGQAYFDNGDEPKKAISRILAAYSILSFGLTGVFAFQNFLFQRTTECSDKGGLYCYVIRDGAIEGLQNCTEVTNDDPIVCYEIVLDVLEGLGQIGSYTALFFFFTGIPKAFNWSARSIAFSTGCGSVAFVVCLVSTIVRLALRNILLAIQPIMFSLSFFLISGILGVLWAWKGCGFDLTK